MTLKLPEPLPYDYVDELINSQVHFTSSESFQFGVRMKHHRAFRNDCEPTNTRNQLICLKDDFSKREEDEIDDDGYIPWYGGGYKWTVQEWSEQELDDWVRHGSVFALMRARDNAAVPEDSNPVQEGRQGQDAQGPVDYDGIGVSSTESVGIH